MPSATEGCTMIDRSPARQAMIRRWLQELNPFRVAVVGDLCPDATAVLDSARERHAPRRAWEGCLPARLRPAVCDATKAEGLTDVWDVAFCFDLESRAPADAESTIELLRRKARFVVAAVPTGGPNAWSAAGRRSLRPLAVQAFAGEELCLLRGGET